MYALLLMAAIGHPHYSCRQYYQPPGHWWIIYYPPVAKRELKPIDPTLADIGYKNRLLTSMIDRERDPQLRQQYRDAKKKLEMRRLQYLSGY